MKNILTIIFIVFIGSQTFGQTPGVSIFYEQYAGDTREYIEYIPGNLPIIISAPHGGVKLSGATVGGTFYPDNDPTLPDRGCGVNERDDNTDILVREIQSEIFALTGCYAHVIINNLHRSKLDPNREEGEAACSDSDAEDHWSAFHDFIDDASLTIEEDWGKGLFLDVHGQSHSIPRIEIGYNISANDINNSNLNVQSVIDNSTIYNLVATNLTELSHQELIQGDNSLGELFHEAPGTFYAAQNYPGCSHNGTNGYRAIPSNTDTGGQPCDDTQPFGNPYFDGDFYNNRRHGSGPGADDGNGIPVGGGGNIDGIMTEVNRRVRDLGTYQGNYYDNNPQTLVPFAQDYAAVILDFLAVHYNDFSAFDYGDCDFSLNGANPMPTILGIEDGTFTSSPNLSINNETGEIDLSTSAEGTYTITFSLEECAYYNSSQTIELKSGLVGHVNIAATGNEDGKTWADAFTNLEDALNSGCIYDTIKIAVGNYIPSTTDRNFQYPLYSNLVIHGGYSPDGSHFNSVSYPAVFDANIGSVADETDNLYHSFFIDNSINNLQLMHLHFVNGYANGSGDLSKGGGLFNKGIIIMKDVKIHSNSSIEEASALHNEGSILISDQVVLENNGSF